ncbi:MAG: MFS transporter [Rhodocyclaceae bacterium]|nr:MFS transporter [Rhodocyclaceae bacterium]
MLSSSPPSSRRIHFGLGLALAAYVLSFFHRVAPAVIAPDLQATFNVGAAQLGNLAATYFYVYTLMQIPTGVLVDTLGPRQVLFGGGLLAGIGALLFGCAATFETAFAARALVGLGVSVTFIATLKIIALNFHERRFATMTGLTMFCGNLGAVAAGAPLALAVQLGGWRSVFVTVGALSLLIGIASRYGVAPTPARGGDRTQWLGQLLRVMRNRHSWPGFFSNIGIAGSFLAFGGLWAVPLLTQSHGLTRTAAANHVSLAFLGLAFGSMAWTRLSDRIGRRRPVMLGASAGYALLWLLLPTERIGVTGLSHGLFFALGFFAASFTLSWACAKEVNAPLSSGMATSVVNVGVFVGAGLLQPLFGALLELRWSGRIAEGVRIYATTDYHRGLTLMAAAAALGFLANLLIRETGCRNIHDALATKQ